MKEHVKPQACTEPVLAAEGDNVKLVQVAEVMQHKHWLSYEAKAQVLRR